MKTDLTFQRADLKEKKTIIQNAQNNTSVAHEIFLSLYLKDIQQPDVCDVSRSTWTGIIWADALMTSTVFLGAHVLRI